MQTLILNLSKELERKPNKKKDMELGYVFNGPVKILKN